MLLERIMSKFQDGAEVGFVMVAGFLLLIVVWRVRFLKQIVTG